MAGPSASKYSRRHSAKSRKPTVEVNLVSYNKACMAIMRRHQKGQPVNEEEHMKIVQEECSRFGVNLSSRSRSPAQRSSSPLSSGYESGSISSGCPSPSLESPATTSEGTSTSSSPGLSSESASTASSSGSSSRSATPPANQFVLSFGVINIDFAIDSSARNAPVTAARVTKRRLDGDAFEIVLDTSEPVVKKTKVFTPEEMKKQSDINEEFRRKVCGIM